MVTHALNQTIMNNLQGHTDKQLSIRIAFVQTFSQVSEYMQKVVIKTLNILQAVQFYNFTILGQTKALASI